MNLARIVRLAALSLAVGVLVSAHDASAQQSEVVEPYFLIMVDTSGSMGTGGSGAGSVVNSCGMPQSRLNTAKCVLGDVLSSLGEANYGLGRFDQVCAVDGDDNDVYTSYCPATSDDPDAGQILVPIGSDNQNELISYVDFAPWYADQYAMSCPGSDTPPEILVNDSNWGSTPLEGTLMGALRYYEGNDPDFGQSPIENDPLYGCRQYAVLLLTDGNETCGGTPGDGAAALRTANVPTVGETDILTYVIGFGVADPTQDVEDIADEGGTTALYANDEASLSQQFTQIIQDSLVAEVCDELNDEDCDGEVDEGYQLYCDLENAEPDNVLCDNPGDDCDGIDDNCFMGTDDEPVNACGTCGPVPTEVCNNIDDDCDGGTDEGVCGGCVFQGVEDCDNVDDDCDGSVDEGLVRTCGSDVGECVADDDQRCIAGVWEACEDTGPTPETCDGEDDDCDGQIDGITRECSDIVANTPPYFGVCQPGQEFCPTDGSGWTGLCVGEIGPSDEACDLADNDCDDDVDEDTGGADCSDGCGVGSTVCVDGMLECQGGGMAEDEVCNNFDDDCDGTVDETADLTDPWLGDDCDPDGELCVPGQWACVAGEQTCVGGEEPLPEVCDCNDNDCNGEIDEGDLCGPGSTCVDCQCATPCGDDEFPCPQGFFCNEADFCVPDPCFDINCPPVEGQPQACSDGDCVPVCDTIECQVGLRCDPKDGFCRADNCLGFPDDCGDDELCVGGVCEPDPCFEVDCQNEEYCFEGECYASCGDVECEGGQICVLGECQDDLCADAGCTSLEYCDLATGECKTNMCVNISCDVDKVCDPVTGECVREPCLGVQCPAGDVCEEGTCGRPSIGDDAGVGDDDYVFVGGAGCSTGGGLGSGGLLLLLAAFLPIAVRRRRFMRLRFPGGFLGTLAIVGALGLSSGCQSDGFCVDCANGDGGSLTDGGDNGDGGGGDASLYDGGAPADACSNSGIEQCDGLDNDCDGEIDEGDLPNVGDECSTDEGECEIGETQCVDGQIRCDGVLPVQESCDNLDNDCDTRFDESVVGVGLLCGTNQGECVAGVTACEDGTMVCNGAVGDVGENPELCNGRDDDCDGDFDEDIVGAPTCGPDTDVGLCEYGSEQCIGGQMQCIGETMPAPEICNNMDENCDGNNTDGFDLDNDSQNCGMCGNVCVADNAVAICDGSGNCAIGACLAGYWDLPPFDYSDGCEWGPCVFQGPEQCNEDDDDCDGEFDEDLVEPDICASLGACANTDPVCDAPNDQWVCNYGADVETDVDGNIVPETRCDGIDNDCDGFVDEGFPQVSPPGQVCDDGDFGQCRGVGIWECTMDGTGVECVIQPGDEGADPAADDPCNGVDDDCDNSVDEDDQDEWVDIGSTEIYAYEASRPDATQVSQGVLSNRVCSKPDALPWTNITYPEAVAACDTVGATLCSEADWQLACELEPVGGGPVQGDDTNGIVFFEAEDFDRNTDAGDEWIEQSAIAGASGNAYMFASTDSGTTRNPDSGSGSPHLEYDVTFTQGGTHYIWIRGYAADSGDDEIHAGINGGGWVDEGPTDEIGPLYPQDQWIWKSHNDNEDRPTVDVPDDIAGPEVHTIDIWMRDDGFRIDKILLTTNPSYIPSGFGPSGQCDYSYSTDCRDYAADTCNGDDYDFDGNGANGDQDGMTYSQEMAQCYANWGGGNRVYDLSGNVREWTLTRGGQENPMRGGSYTSSPGGLRCDHDFLVADDDFEFPNVGFRCCRPSP